MCRRQVVCDHMSQQAHWWEMNGRERACTTFFHHRLRAFLSLIPPTPQPAKNPHASAAAASASAAA